MRKFNATLNAPLTKHFKLPDGLIWDDLEKLTVMGCFKNKLGLATGANIQHTPAELQQHLKNASQIRCYSSSIDPIVCFSELKKWLDEANKFGISSPLTPWVSMVLEISVKALDGIPLPGLWGIFKTWVAPVWANDLKGSEKARDHVAHYARDIQDFLIMHDLSFVTFKNWIDEILTHFARSQRREHFLQIRLTVVKNAMDLNVWLDAVQSFLSQAGEKRTGFWHLLTKMKRSEIESLFNTIQQSQLAQYLKQKYPYHAPGRNLFDFPSYLISMNVFDESMVDVVVDEEDSRLAYYNRNHHRAEATSLMFKFILHNGNSHTGAFSESEQYQLALMLNRVCDYWKSLEKSGMRHLLITDPGADADDMYVLITHAVLQNYYYTLTGKLPNVDICLCAHEKTAPALMTMMRKYLGDSVRISDHSTSGASYHVSKITYLPEFQRPSSKARWWSCCSQLLFCRKCRALDTERANVEHRLLLK